MARRVPVEPAHIPSSTYRLQLNRDFTFRQAAEIADYLQALGIGDCYLSPFFMAAPGSVHGYDVTNSSCINPEIGGDDDFHTFTERVRQHGMGIVADVVPNHMCIDNAANEWWWDVLENGPSSPFARYFDIDWRPPKRDLANKVLLPILGDQFGRVLEGQQIAVRYDRGAFFASVYDKMLPLTPRSWTLVLEPALAALKARVGEGNESFLELESILTALSHLAGPEENDADRIRERQREKAVVRKRLAALTDSSPEARAEIENSLRQMNGEKGNPASFDRLEQLLSAQPYRLAFWKVAADEINYRRFFDINQLAAIRIEDPEVFQAVHALLFDLIRQGRIDGLRVDHSDGLRDPAEYFRRLQSAARKAGSSTKPWYIVTEKILVGNEELRRDWDIAGTTGYDFLALANGLFIDGTRRRAFRRLYERYTLSPPCCDDLIYQSKRLILQTTMSSELNVLSGKLDRISEQHRWSRDFTFSSLRHALRETVACFPIYRTYISMEAAKPDAEDERHIRQAINRAKQRNPSTDRSIFGFLQSVMLLEDPGRIDAVQQRERHEFILSFQQFTGPVMAKGLEDTTFYRYFPLLSINEVGGDPAAFGVSPAVFHNRNMERLKLWPHSLLATATHDTKRGEDVRTRINVLSEMPNEWYRAIRGWRRLNESHRVNVSNVETPTGAEEYLFYQTLTGIWPMEDPGTEELASLTARMLEYMRKAIREAKLFSSWINPNPPHEEAVEQFVQALLDPSPENRFLTEFRSFVNTIRVAGMWNSLAQVLLKIAAPGVPDFYQGSELWDFNLVDPDNRRPVDYSLRRQLMEKLKTAEASDPAAQISELLAHPEDGAIKMHLVRRALCFRKSNRDLFDRGSYIPLRASGNRQNHVVAFARVLGDRSVIAATGRLFQSLGAGVRAPVGEKVWGDSGLLIRREPRARVYRDVFTQTTVEAAPRNGKRMLPLDKVFAHMPVALLESVA